MEFRPLPSRVPAPLCWNVVDVFDHQALAAVLKHKSILSGWKRGPGTESPYSFLGFVLYFLQAYYSNGN